MYKQDPSTLFTNDHHGEYADNNVINDNAFRTNQQNV